MMRFAVPVVLLLLVFGIFSVSSRTVFREYFFPVVANPRYSLIGHWLLSPHLKDNGKICVLKLESLLQFDQQEKNVIQVERRVSLISEPEEVIPKISTTGEGTTLWKPNSDALALSSLPEYIDLPFLADNLDYVQTEQISSVAQTSD